MKKMKKTKLINLDLTEVELNQVLIALAMYKDGFKERHGMPLVESLCQRIAALLTTDEEDE